VRLLSLFVNNSITFLPEHLSETGENNREKAPISHVAFLAYQSGV
jgi:hypothetical protein